MTVFIALIGNSLYAFNANNPMQAFSVGVTGIEGTLLGIDTRPANGLIYGVTTTNNIYSIDPQSLGFTINPNGALNNIRTPVTVAATFVSTLSEPFEGGIVSGLDFNPVPDRLRLVGENNQNFRINVDTGEVIVDGTLAFAADDPNGGINPTISASGYTNSFAGTTSTQLYNIDTQLNTLVLQNPPNDGTLVTIGNLGVDFGNLAGFDIVSGMDGENAAFAVANSMLYSIDLMNGQATSLGMIGGLSGLDFRGLATVPTSTFRDTITGETEFNPAQYLASHPDLIAAYGYNIGAAIDHFQVFGRAENRALSTFDQLGYLASYGDLIEAIGLNRFSATHHYLAFGVSEGRVTNLFDPVSYLNTYADLRAAFGNDLVAATEHYILNGFSEGRVF
ncbi:DUF4394 domain-containing protein [Oscillatoria acuminata]|uniref:DUF4394 domain-containing protein n=1 Tax=Oscillatoria acuminata PCC 6304 TaxID=56110 RepID=K9TKZ0_9CYAN|nr:DUF4394 domain-containing protein [Oscillatoria acuminata]AFY83527.1 hypothetical protein Oscil6304_3988 [Oscillatoria acuminata PCC 6304]